MDRGAEGISTKKGEGENAMSMRGMIATALFVGALAVWPLSAARAESQEDREACTPEVHRLCGQYIPDREAIIQCLKHNIKNLVPACRRVMTRPYKEG